MAKLDYLTEEERRVATEMFDYFEKSARLLIETRLSAEVGSEQAKRIMQKLYFLVDKGLSEKEIADQLRGDAEIKGAVLTGIAITAIVVRGCSPDG